MQSPSIVAFDLETTGADPLTASPVQICLLSQVGSERRVWLNTLIRPEHPIPDGAKAVHGISNEDVSGKPDAAFVAWTVALLCETLRPGYVVGFNSKSFDEPILTRLLGSRPFGHARSVDVLDIAYRFYPELPSHKLGELYRHFFGRPLEGAHDAMADVGATLDVLSCILGEIGRTIEQVAEEMETPKPYEIFPISKRYKGWKTSEVPRSMASWLLETSAREGRALRPDMQATVEYILARNRQ